MSSFATRGGLAPHLDDWSPDTFAFVDLAQSQLGAPPDLTLTSSGVLGGFWAISSRKMIATRMQDHIIETSDGDLHILANAGRGDALRLLTSTDGGESWGVTLTLPGTGSRSSADIRMVESNGNDRAIVTYATENGEIIYQSLFYDTALDSWSRSRAFVVEEGLADAEGINPTVTVEADRDIWVGYAAPSIDGVTVTLAWSQDFGLSWTSAEFTDPEATNGSARVLATPDGVGVVYATSAEVIWLTYDESMALWSEEVIVETGSVGFFASHFSTTSVGDDIYLANVDLDQALDVFRFDGATGVWSEVLTLPPQAELATTVQISAGADGTVYVIYDEATSLDLVVIASTDAGASWSQVARLDTPDFLYQSPMRFEAPEQFDEALVIVQQVGLPGNDQISFLYQYTLAPDTAAPDLVLQAETLGQMPLATGMDWA